MRWKVERDEHEWYSEGEREKKIEKNGTKSENNQNLELVCG